MILAYESLQTLRGRHKLEIEVEDDSLLAMVPEVYGGSNRRARSRSPSPIPKFMIDPNERWLEQVRRDYDTPQSNFDSDAPVDIIKGIAKRLQLPEPKVEK